MAEALRHRGVAEPTATLAGEVGSLAFRGAFSRWADPACKKQFAELAREILDERRAATAALARGLAPAESGSDARTRELSQPPVAQRRDDGPQGFTGLREAIVLAP